MNTIDESLKDLTEIRSMMERSSKFLSLSGLAGVSAGVVALTGAGAAYFTLNRNETLEQQRNLLDFFIYDAIAVLTFALGLAIFFSVRMAKKKNLPVWNHTAKYLLYSLLVPLASGGLFCLILWYHGLVILIAPSTLVFYGLALLNSSKFTVTEIRYLALAEIVLGLLATLLLDYWLAFWSIGFGLLHIAYGILIYVKYEK
jgi:predicted lysophospholipase L1 biosynthesis ABC-type transport system permease subunit